MTNQPLVAEERKAVSVRGLTAWTVAFVALVAVAIPVARVAVFHSSRPYFFGQGYMYKELAVALASGQGYTEPHGLWPSRPTITRPPLWPVVLSLPMRLCPGCDSLAITRAVEAVMHAFTAFGVALLVWTISGSVRRMGFAVLVTVLLPDAQPLLLGGYCEPLATALLVGGILLICKGERWFYSGVLVLSLLPLVRPNFLLLWMAAMVVIGWWQFRGSSRMNFVSWRRLIAAAILFAIPSAAWIARNYVVSGRFPILAGTSGMTFYGNYNSLSGAAGPGFGRWIHPDEVPGEEKVKNLSEKLTEAQVLRYYDLKGREFIAQHWKVVPLLFAAHLVRSVSPSPSDGAHKYPLWVFRLILYAATIVAIRQKSIPLDSWFGIMFMSTVLVSLMTVVLFSGDDRYLYPLQILLLVFVCSTRYLRFASVKPLSQRYLRGRVAIVRSAQHVKAAAHRASVSDPTP